MSNVIQHLYKFSSLHGGLLYAWFPSMHTRVDIVLCGRQGEESLMIVISAIHEMLCRLEKMANYYDAESELAYLNYSIQLSPQEHTLFFLQPGVTINLSGFLKGYALEKIRELLQQYEIENALVNMGNSSVLALGHHPLADGWKVNFGQSAVTQAKEWPEIFLKNECLTTSGNDSHERKHIIDPQSGKLVEGKREVAVVTANGAVGYS